MTERIYDRTFRNHVRQFRVHLLAILDRIEAEIERTEPTPEDQPSLIEPLSDAAGLAASECLTDRHYWILTQLGQGTRLTRRHVMERFGYSERHTKRILTALTKRGLIEFRRDPWPGHYVLCKTVREQNPPSE